MPLTYNITITDLAKEYFPYSVVKKYKNIEIIRFNWHQVIFNQSEIVAFWRICNNYHIKPIAKTFLGRISSIKIIHEI